MDENIKAILHLDCTEKQNIDRLISELGKLKPFKKVYSETGEIPIEYLEKLIKLIDVKYQFGIRNITPDCNSNKDKIIWRATILRYKDICVIGQIFGISMYEVLCKTALFMFYTKDEM